MDDVYDQNVQDQFVGVYIYGGPSIWIAYGKNGRLNSVQWAGDNSIHGTAPITSYSLCIGQTINSSTFRDFGLICLWCYAAVGTFHQFPHASSAINHTLFALVSSVVVCMPSNHRLHRRWRNTKRYTLGIPERNTCTTSFQLILFSVLSSWK